MKALVITEPGKIQWRHVEKPVPGPKEVLIEVKAVGICGTDLHILHGKHGAVTYPRIPGHEMVGKVVGVGKEVNNVGLGDHVAVDPVVSCGKCPMCLRGRHNICYQVKCLGVQTEGAFTQYVKVNGDKVYSFNPDIPWETAALVEPFSIAAQIAERLRISFYDKILIVGGGTIGLALLQVVNRIYGSKAVVADISHNKLLLAREMGAQCAINPQETDVIKRSAEIWNYEGPTVVVEAVGSSKILNSLLEKALPGSRIGVIGFMAEPVNILPVEITKKELEIIGSRMNRNKFPEVLTWFKEGKLEPEKLISHKLRFEEAEQAFALFDDRLDEVCKVIIQF
ncbi:MAG: alcohol dehydrogenase catalytic domain-containing protein [Bacillota bacterium]